MVTRANHRVTMWQLQPSGTTPGRLSYSSLACPNGVQYCDNATAWAGCCYDLGGSYSITPQRAYQLLLQAGWYGDDVYSALYLINRESSFVPDVIAHCAPCCCTEAGVNAVGLLQVTIEAHPEYSISYLSDPLNNLRAAKAIQARDGWGPWTPNNAALYPSTIAYWQGIVGTAGNYGNEPGQSLATDIGAAPNDTPPPSVAPAGPPPSVTPPAPTIHVDYIGLPDVYSEARSGWDAIAWHYTNDVPYYTGYDAEIVRRLGALLELRA